MTILPPQSISLSLKSHVTGDLHTNKAFHLPAVSHAGQILPLKGFSKPAGFGLPCSAALIDHEPSQGALYLLLVIVGLPHREKSKSSCKSSNYETLSQSFFMKAVTS